MVSLQQTIPLARKWRPSQFHEVISQKPIVQTLQNALLQNRIHSAYLFSGPRGIGKTSLARLFAKALRCQDLKKEKDRLLCCQTCSDCTQMNQGRNLHVIEIDGASHNGVESIRDLVEKVHYLPSSGKKKIYIIDEVHMLSTAAFNALLKTLEEPPAHILFIFATTEVHKVLPTILSRCQRFDFKQPTIDTLQTHLQAIAKEEKISLQPQAAYLLAQAAEGSFRDALSLLDQMVAFAPNHIDTESVQSCFGLCSQESLLKITESILKKDPLTLHKTTTELYQKGVPCKHLLQSLLEWFHALICQKAHIPIPSFTSIPTDRIELLLTYRSLEELELFFQVLHHGLEQLSKSPTPKLYLDVLLLKCTLAEALFSFDQDTTSTPSQKHTVSQTHHTTKHTTLSSTPNPDAQNTSSSTHLALDHARPSKNWPDFLEYLRKHRPLTAATLEHGIPIRFESPRILIAFSSKDAYKKEQLELPSRLKELQKLTQAFFQDPSCQLHFQISSSVTVSKTTVSKKEQIHQKKEEALLNQPLIQEAKSLFGGTLSCQLKENPTTSTSHT